MEQTTPLIHALDTQKNKQKKSTLFVSIICIIAILGGITTGYIVSMFTNTTQSTSSVSSVFQTGDKSGEEKVIQTAGIPDKENLKDKTEGILREGGIEGEGTFHLERPGGPTQNAYLTSTTVDLEPFIGKKVRVWGSTFEAKKAGWLMDVGFVELLQ